MGKAGKARGLHVLVADDDEQSLWTLQDLVETEGHVVLPARCGAEALEVARAHRIDLSILDYHMPDLDGPETLVRIRRIHVTLPCIFVTGDFSEVAEARARAAGGFAVLRKPLELEIFRTVIDELAAQLDWLWRLDRPLEGPGGPFEGRA